MRRRRRSRARASRVLLRPGLRVPGVGAAFFGADPSSPERGGSAGASARVRPWPPEAAPGRSGGSRSVRVRRYRPPQHEEEHSAKQHDCGNRRDDLVHDRNRSKTGAGLARVWMQPLSPPAPVVISSDSPAALASPARRHVNVSSPAHWALGSSPFSTSTGGRR